jgi:predicted permease
VAALVEVILPVFLVIGAGALGRGRGWIADAGIDGLMAFAQGIAVPCLLFRAMVDLDLAATFQPALFASFYTGAAAGFVAGLLGARHLFGRPWEDSVAVGFCGLFSNALLLGLPITERAYGPGALEANYAIVALHAPFCYALGIGAMEIARARGHGLRAAAAAIARALGRNPLVIGILLGLAVNLAGLALPEPVAQALDLFVRAAIPAALFGLGGVLWRYRPEGDLRLVLYVVAVSLLLHPAVVWGLGRASGLTLDEFRSAVLTAAMPPGVNAYVFASLYGAARRVAAASVLIGTLASILTGWGWLSLLP